MKTIKKILFVFAILLCMPMFVNAKEYVEYTNFICDGETCNGKGTSGDGMIYNMNNAKNYEFTIIGSTINENETYTLTIVSDYKNETKTISGTELKTGYTYSNNDGNSKMKLELKDSKGEYVYIKDIYNPESTIKAFLHFNNNYNESKFDKILNSIPKTKDDKIHINAIKPDNEMLSESPITMLLEKYAKDPLHLFGSINNGQGYITIGEYDGFYKQYKVEFEFEETNPKIKEKVNKYLKEFTIEENSPIEENLMLMEDLETINYRYNEILYGSSIEMGNSMVNYSSEFKKKIKNNNLTAKLDTRAGWAGPFYGGAFGFLNLEYNGIVYGTVEVFGFRLANIIYVPDNTKDTREAYIEAALKRIKDYLPKSAKVELTYKDLIANINEDELDFTIDELVDVSKTLGEYYNLKLNGEDLDFFIVKDSSKIKKPEFNTEDIETNIIIKTDNSEVPLDTKIMAEILGKDTKEYKELMKQLNAKNGMTLDLKLFSESIKKYISKLSDGNFKVYVPIPENLRGKNISAYYIKDDGTIEEHKITVEGDYFVFDTTHFSMYTLAEKEEIKNPQTYDGIMSSIMFTVVSICGIVLILTTYKKEQNN